EENMALEEWELGELSSALAGERHFLDRLGSTNPSHVSTGEGNYGWMLLEAHRPEEATAWFERALAAADKVDGRHDEETEFALAGLGAAWVARGRPRLALAPLERALTLQHGEETASDRADTEMALAQALALTSRDSRRALVLAQEARDYYANHPLGARRAHQQADAEAWLRAHGAAR
ncbi:MAG TPA: tetratricopeptide repeat protein, partial [Polyangia bacterium]